MVNPSVNHLQLRWIVSKVNPAYRWVEISIDGRNLIDLVTEWENGQMFPTQTQGEYQGVPEQNFVNREFYMDAWFGFEPGSSDDEWIPNGAYEPKIAILGCGNEYCGVVDCWPLICNISVEDEHVTWNDFDNPRRVDRILSSGNEGIDPATDFYAGFGPFVFRKANYVSELNALLANTEYVGPVD